MIKQMIWTGENLKEICDFLGEHYVGKDSFGNIWYYESLKNPNYVGSAPGDTVSIHENTAEKEQSMYRFTIFLTNGKQLTINANEGILEKGVWTFNDVNKKNDYLIPFENVAFIQRTHSKYTDMKDEK